MITQGSLFEAVPAYHHNAGHTEKAAAKSMVEPGKSIKERFAAWLESRRFRGAIRDEFDRAFGTTPNVSAPRLRELEQEGRIRKTNRTREGRSGRKGVVYVAFEFQD